MATMRVCKFISSLPFNWNLQFPPPNSPRSNDAFTFSSQPDILASIGIMAFAFFCHHSTFLIYQSMRDSSFELWERVTHISIGFAFVVSACFGIFGYSTFTTLSQGMEKHEC